MSKAFRSRAARMALATPFGSFGVLTFGAGGVPAVLATAGAATFRGLTAFLDGLALSVFVFAMQLVFHFVEMMRDDVPCYR